MSKRIQSPLLLSALFCLVLANGALAEDKNVRVYEARNGNIVYLMAKLDRCREATITVSATLENMVSSVPLPLTVDIAELKPLATDTGSYCLVTLRPRDPSLRWNYAWQFHWKPGGRFKGEPQSYVYALPFRSGPFQVIQGPHGAFTHQVGSQDAEAVDWAMPIGTTLYAARAGTVVALRTDCVDGAPDKRLLNDYNYLILKHDDGTFAEYLHLQKDGVLVHLGDRVALNQPIALSGATGFASMPHLHFAVFYTLNGYARKTIPVSFKARNGETIKPEEGQTY